MNKLAPAPDRLGEWIQEHGKLLWALRQAKAGQDAIMTTLEEHPERMPVYEHAMYYTRKKQRDLILHAVNGGGLRIIQGGERHGHD